MVGRQCTDHRAEVPQLLLRGADSEQTTILLHHVDAGTAICRIDHQMHCTVRRKDIAQRSKAGIRVGQMMEHARADDLVEFASELPDLLDRESMEIEVLQAIFSLKIARIAQAGFADVDCGHTSLRLAQRMDGSLGRSTAGDQDLSICPQLLRWPQQKGQCPTPIRVSVEFAVPIEVADRRRIRVGLVESAYLFRSPSPRLRGEGWGEGPFLEFGQQRLENSVQISNHIVVPDADHAITEGA